MASEEGFMFWTGFIVGVLLGANLGIVIAGMLFSAKRRDAENHSSGTTKEYSVMDEGEATPAEMPSLPESVT
jgi:hypothetical protein